MKVSFIDNHLNPGVTTEFVLSIPGEIGVNRVIAVLLYKFIIIIVIIIIIIIILLVFFNEDTIAIVV